MMVPPTHPQDLCMRQIYLATVLMAASAVAMAQEVSPTPTAPPAAAVPASPITDHFAARVSYYMGKVSTTGSVTDPFSPTPGTPVSMEDDFGLTPDVHQGRVEFIFRMRERHRLRVDLWEVNRSATTTPTKDIVFGDATLTPLDTVVATFNWRQSDFTYTYSVLHRPRFELGVGLAMHLIEADAETRVYARAVHESLQGAGPFGTIAADGSVLISPRFSFNARAQYMSLHLNNNTGKLGDYHADLQFRWKPNLALGLGYQSTQEQVTVSKSDPNGEMKFDVHGPELFLRASF
jgi:hypothetical protein